MRASNHHAMIGTCRTGGKATQVVSAPQQWCIRARAFAHSFSRFFEWGTVVSAPQQWYIRARAFAHSFSRIFEWGTMHVLLEAARPTLVVRVILV